MRLSVTACAWLLSARLNFTVASCRRDTELDADAFELYLAASVWEYGTVSADYADLSDEEAVSFDVFRVICYAVPIGLYGTDAIKISERRPGKQKNRKRKEGKDRE